MRILGIESSCDDTSVSLIEASEKGFSVLAEKTASQIDIHKKYGGVIPEVAARAHAEYILPLIEEVLAGQQKPQVIAVTSGPGLMTALLVGVEAARTLSYLWDIPLVGVNHIEGHIYSVLIEELKISQVVNRPPLTPSPRLRFGVAGPHRGGSFDINFPALCLIVSGGHTELILIKDQGVYEKIGKTVDDAAGECFDKVAKLLGLEYPGGPKISQLAMEGNSQAIEFPRPMIKEKNYDLSFAGLKTAALYWLRENQGTSPRPSPLRRGSLINELSGKSITPPQPSSVRLSSPKSTRGGNISVQDFCASFEQAIVDVLVTKTLRAAEEYKPRTIILGGGVSANKKLRQTLAKEIQQQLPETKFLIPELAYAMDNATMIAVAGYYKAQKQQYVQWKELRADPQWEL